MPTAQHGNLTVSPRRKNLHITVTIKGWSAPAPAAGSCGRDKDQPRRLICWNKK